MIQWILNYKIAGNLQQCQIHINSQISTIFFYLKADIGNLLTFNFSIIKKLTIPFSIGSKFCQKKSWIVHEFYLQYVFALQTD